MLCREEYIAAVYTGRAYSLSDTDLVPADPRGIDMPMIPRQEPPSRTSRAVSPSGVCHVPNPRIGISTPFERRCVSVSDPAIFISVPPPKGRQKLNMNPSVLPL